MKSIGKLSKEELQITFDSLTELTGLQALAVLLKVGVIETPKLSTFGHIITRIFTHDMEVLEGHVTFWEDHTLTVTMVEGDHSVLLKHHDPEVFEKCPTSKECAELYSQAFNDYNKRALQTE